MNTEDNTGKRPKRAVILDTDWYTDCDDVVAVRVLARAQRLGMVDVLGISVDAANPYSAASLRAFTQAEGIGEVPIAIDHQSYDYGGEVTYHKRLAASGTGLPSNSDCEESVAFYRRTLANAPGQVEIISIGFLQVLADLLKTPPDAVSPDSGMELVRKKVRKLWVMGGRFDASGTPKEFNFSCNAKACRAAHDVLELFPAEITLLGFEVGAHVISGGVLKNTPDDVLYRALCDHGHPEGRASWDPMLVLLACIGDEREAGYDTVRGRASVSAETGCNAFERSPDGRHAYVVKRLPDDEYAAQINEMLLPEACPDGRR